jgi:hypothetical protein
MTLSPSRRGVAVTLLSGILLSGLLYWFANNTHWADMTIPSPPKGEALTNPFYAAERFAEALGAQASHDRTLLTPPSDAVIVLSAWNWNLSQGRRQTLERWVESGGRLVVDASVAGGAEFERWSGIVRGYRDPDDSTSGPQADQRCGRLEDELPRQAAGRASRSPDRSHWLCDIDLSSFLTTTRSPAWSLREPMSGVQVLRVRLGRGSVTAINAEPFRDRALFEGDHGWLLAAASQLRRGDEVHFLSEGDYPSLIALTWQHGAPVVVLVLISVALMLWRGGVRIGPLLAPTPTARRSLAEQVRGTGAFVLRHGGAESLHAACVRALDEVARRRIAGYTGLPVGERMAALARLTGFEPNALADAIYHSRMRRSHEWPGTIALLETARRRMLTNEPRSLYGT